MHYGPWMPLIGMLHGFGALFFGFGILFLLVWAWKTWKPHDYRKAGMWFLGTGVILCAVAIGVRVGMKDIDGKDKKIMKSYDCVYDKK